MKTEFFDVYVYCRGIRKRCRKEELKGFPLPRAPLGIATSADVLEQYKQDARALLEREMKEIKTDRTMPYLVFTYGYEEGDFKYSLPFNDNNFKVLL